MWVVDFDQPSSGGAPIVGPAVTQTMVDFTNSPGNHITFQTQPTSKFNNSTLEVRHGVYKDHAWAAIIIQPYATDLLRNAVVTSNTSYDPSDACEKVYVEARDQSTLESYILPVLSSLQTSAVAAVGRAWTQELFSGSTNPNASALIAVPQAVAPAIGFKDVNLRPFGPPQVTPAVTVGLIYLIIIAFFSYTFFMVTTYRLQSFSCAL